MNKFNSYLDLQRTREKRQKAHDKKNIKLVNFKFLEEPKRNKMNFDIVFTQRNLNKKNINFLNNKGTSGRKGILKNKNELTNVETDKKISQDKTKALYYVEKTQKDNSMISFYDGIQLIADQGKDLVHALLFFSGSCGYDVVVSLYNLVVGFDDIHQFVQQRRNRLIFNRSCRISDLLVD